MEPKVANILKMYYATYGSDPFYIKGKAPFIAELLKEKLITLKKLPGDVSVITIIGAGKLLEQLNQEDN
jgi:hypothetical protein